MATQSDEVFYEGGLGDGYDVIVVKRGPARAEVQLTREDGCIVWAHDANMQGAEPTDAEIDEWVEMAEAQKEIVRV